MRRAGSHSDDGSRESRRILGRVLGASAAMAAVTAAGNVTNVFLTAGLGRTMGSEFLGEIGAAQAFGGLVYAAAALGTTPLITAALARKDADWRFVSNALALRLLTFAVLSSVVLSTTRISVRGWLIVNVLANTAVEASAAVMRGRSFLVRSSVVVLVYRTLLLMAIPVAAVTANPTTVAVSMTIITLLVGIASCRGSLPALARWRPDRRSMLKAGRSGLPLALSSGLEGLVVRGDVLVLGLMASSGDTGAYFAASTIAVGAGALSYNVTLATFPTLVRSTSIIDALRPVNRASLLVFSLVAAPGVLAAPLVIEIIYGDVVRNSDAATVLRILLVALPVVVSNRLTQAALIAIDARGDVLRNQIIAGTTVICAAAVGFDVLGLRGPAIASVLGDAVLLVCGRRALHRRALLTG